jgi:signal transduction histidine kinase
VRRRLLLVTLAVTTLLVAAFAIPLALLVRDVARDRAITDAERDTAALVPVLSAGADAALLAEALERTTAGAEGRLAVWLPDGTRVGDERAADEDDVALARDRGVAFSRTHGDEVDVYTPVVVDGGDTVVLRVHIPAALLHEGVATAWAILAALAVGLLGLAVLVSDRLARSITRPAVDLAATGRALAAGDARARAEVGGPPEIADVGAALNLLADRIDELRAAERERVADLSHRLRTPLTALRLDAEAAGAGAVVADVDRLEGEVNELIRLARRPLHDSVRAGSDLAAVAEDRAAFWGALADDDGRRWTCTVDPPGPHPVALSVEEAGAALDALLGNVFAHTVEGTPYAVSLVRDGGRERLSVTDEGPGIADPSVLERGRSSAGSTGLGLDIAARAASDAGGALRLERAPGGGAVVVLDLPALEEAGT